MRSAHGRGRDYCIGVAVLFAPLFVWAAENQSNSYTAGDVPCDCSAYEENARIARWSRDINTVTLGLLIPEGKAFQMTPQVSEILRLRWMAQAGVPEHCRQNLLKTDDVRLMLILRHSLMAHPSFAAPTNAGEYFNRVSNDIMIAVEERCKGLQPLYAAPLPPPPVDCSKARLERAAEYAQTDEGKQVLLASSQYNRVGEMWNGIDMTHLLPLYLRFVDSGDQESALGFIRKNRAQFSTQEILIMGQAMGSLAYASGYDQNRADGVGRAAEGIVSFDQVLHAMRQNAVNVPLEKEEQRRTYFGADRLSPGEKFPQAYAGVCRDIASAQGQFFEAAGMRNTYVVAYTLGNGGFHTSVITQDPQSRAVYRLNYGEKVSTETLRSEVALFQSGANGKDASFNYRLFRPGGSLVADVPSAAGKFFSEMSGGDVRDLDPLGRSNDSVVASQVQIAKTGTAARVFYGKDGIGQDYLGAAVTQVFRHNQYFSSRVGLVLADQIKPTALSGTERDENTLFLYLEAQGRARTPSLKTSRGESEIHLEGKATLIGGIHGMPSDKNAKVGYQGDARIEGGIRATHNMPSDAPLRDDRVQSQIYVGAQVVPGLGDIRENSSASNFRPTLNYGVVMGELRMRLDDRGDAHAALLATLLCSQIGCRGQAEAQAIYRDFAAALSVEGAISNEIPPYEEQVERRLRARLLWRILGDSRLLLQISGYRSLQSDAMGAQGTLIWSH